VLTEELKDKIIKLKSGRAVTVKIINDILAYCGIKITEGILKSLLAAPRFVLDDLHKKETIEILKDKIGGPWDKIQVPGIYPSDYKGRLVSSAAWGDLN